ncbi:anti-CBASS protein Acb1 family protein [Lichenifustis flavocetrariae]|uniref:DUF1073 domain-containing protein n=1 Tax=Lichenifustis flavocetrariae TaxID=2949735 RepID=A0AA41Z197_9HYPH|nr:anti-CBASS Acb1 family protein [Lichenifustis flavocetrariae]MCW6510978.1 DUF1073 domain-containing protein [Lichenifustis flavocetrariae]
MGADLWSDSVLTALYDAIHAVALTTTGATSLMHEAKVDVVTVPDLSEHLSNAATTAQLSARFGYAATMKSLNNLLLLGDGETWTRQGIDFAGLPEMVRTFLQVAAGAADIPVTRLLGQSPAGLSSTGDHDIRNYYDMIAARQEIELRPQLERLDRLLMARPASPRARSPSRSARSGRWTPPPRPRPRSRGRRRRGSMRGCGRRPSWPGSWRVSSRRVGSIQT